MALAVLAVCVTGCPFVISGDVTVPTDNGVDSDGDGFFCSDGVGCEWPRIKGEDCNDSDLTIYPGATEVCDGVDNNCDNIVDEDPAMCDAPDYYVDNDNDGVFGEDCGACDQPYAVDCNDADATIYPYAEEVCDGVDNNCDGVIDEDGYWLCEDDNACSIDRCGGGLCNHVQASDCVVCTAVEQCAGVCADEEYPVSVCLLGRCYCEVEE